MKTLFVRLAWMILLAAACAAARAEPVAGRDYVVLDPPRPAASGARIEVIEFFYYGCPVCYEAQPHIARWLLAAGNAVDLKRVPAVSSDAWATFARIFYALDATGLLDRLHWPVYDNHQFDGLRLNEEKNLLDWLQSNGVDAARFKQALESEDVKARVETARKMLAAYDVRGVPTLIVDGRYVTSARLAGGVKEMMDVVEYLVARAREERAKK
ncbi:MAG TPA: thiol:disulfide interchange protein DsbA/DsbL [Burkholderiales bacterium]|nr:thiol:disulfide interchange protein DsbA/DsbL [Burkholderiales bacterium]